MLPGRYLAVIGLSLLLATPVAAQTPSPPKSPSSPAATAPSPTEKATGKPEQAIHMPASRQTRRPIKANPGRKGLSSCRCAVIVAADNIRVEGTSGAT